MPSAPADILLVEDRADECSALERILEPLGQRLVCASSAADALRQLCERDVALIVLAVRTPALDGLDAARRIRAREAGPLVPIIAVTDRGARAQDLTHAYRAGAADCLVKPIEPAVLRAKARTFVDLWLQQRWLVEQERRRRELARQELELGHLRELEELHGALRHHQRELERAMGARSRFYASMSHELRTPINAVLGYSTLLLENVYGPLNEKQTEGVERTQRAARHLLELVNDLLDLSKIEAGKIDLRLQAVELPALLEDLLATVRPRAEERGATLTLEAMPGGPIKIVSDPRRVRQIVLDLLSDAIAAGHGPIAVSCAATGDGGALIGIRDRGGASPDEEGQLIQEFLHTGAAPQGGPGLGLPVSRRLAELLHGSLTVTSEPGRGTTFHLWLPRSAEARPAEGDTRSTRTTSSALA